MKVLKTLLILAISIILVATVLIVVCAKIYLTPEAVGETLSREIEQRLKRKASFDTVEVDLFRGIKVTGLAIHKSYPWETSDFVTCKEIRIKHGLVPLLFKKILIRNIVIEKPIITVQHEHEKP